MSVQSFIYCSQLSSPLETKSALDFASLSIPRRRDSRSLTFSQTLATMSSAASRRITKEYAELQAEWPPHVVAQPDESNLLHWTGVITGPPTSSYKDGKFKIDITFPLEYPFKSPTVKFVTRIYHPNVTDDGAICIGLLKAEAWKPSTKIDAVLRALVQLLEEPNPDDALVASIAEIYNTDRKQFTKNAQEWVKKYAS